MDKVKDSSGLFYLVEVVLIQDDMNVYMSVCYHNFFLLLNDFIF